jgi:hypothetical protein
VRPFLYTTTARCASSSSVAFRIDWLSMARMSPVYEEISTFPPHEVLVEEPLARLIGTAAVSAFFRGRSVAARAWVASRLATRCTALREPGALRPVSELAHVPFVDAHLLLIK